VTQVAKYYGADKETELQGKFKALAAAYVSRDPGAFAATSGQLRALLVSLSPSVYPDFASLQREVHYNSFHPFRKAMVLYAIRVRDRIDDLASAEPGPYWIGFAAFVAGVVVHGYAFYLRVMISGRAPVTNMYESVVWVSFGAAFFAMILEAIYRQRYYIVGAVPLSILLLLLADQFPAVLDPSLGPLVPVLRNNWLIWCTCRRSRWATRRLWLQWAWDTSRWRIMFSRRWRGQTIAKLENLVYRAMQIGVLLLAAGTILAVSGRIMRGPILGWDPKETWALIALVSYLIPLHGRLAGWLSNYALSVRASCASCRC